MAGRGGGMGHRLYGSLRAPVAGSQSWATSGQGSGTNYAIHAIGAGTNKCRENPQMEHPAAVAKLCLLVLSGIWITACRRGVGVRVQQYITYERRLIGH